MIHPFNLTKIKLFIVFIVILTTIALSSCSSNKTTEPSQSQQYYKVKILATGYNNTVVYALPENKNFKYETWEYIFIRYDETNDKMLITNKIVPNDNSNNEVLLIGMVLEAPPIEPITIENLKL